MLCYAIAGRNTDVAADAVDAAAAVLVRGSILVGGKLVLAGVVGSSSAPYQCFQCCRHNVGFVSPANNNEGMTRIESQELSSFPHRKKTRGRIGSDRLERQEIHSYRNNATGILRPLRCSRTDSCMVWQVNRNSII